MNQCLLLSVLLIGCAATTETIEQDHEEVVSVKDLSVMETELRLVKDSRDSQGRFKRSDARLKAGPCFAQTMGSAHGNEYQVRRYTEGAAFFKKQTNKPGEGDDRPVMCLDIDSGAETRLVDLGTLDASVRYHLGRETRTEGASGHTFHVFERGAIGVINEPPTTPDSLDAPRFRGKTMSHFRAGPNEDAIPVEVTNLVFTFAWKDALLEDDFTMKNDPAGKLVRVDDVDGITLVRYERIDVLHSARAGRESIRIQPKDVGLPALVKCERPISSDGLPTGKFVCTNL